MKLKLNPKAKLYKVSFYDSALCSTLVLSLSETGAEETFRNEYAREVRMNGITDRYIQVLSNDGNPNNFNSYLYLRGIGKWANRGQREPCSVVVDTRLFVW